MSDYAYPFHKFKPTPHEDKNIDPSTNKFLSWSKNNFYRTNYQSMSTNVPLEPKAKAIPRYGGWVPGLVTDNHFAQSYTPITVDCFKKFRSEKSFRPASTGAECKFDGTMGRFLPPNDPDPFKTASSNKYGVQTLQKNHPALDSELRITQSQFTYQDPRRRNFNNAPLSESQVNLRPSTVSSGFLSNYKTCDGKGWVPMRILDSTKRDATEYRDQYNKEKPTHRSTKLFCVRKLKKKANNLL